MHELAASFPDVAEPFQRLVGSQIKARIAGMEFTDQVHFASVSERNGRTSFVVLIKRGTGTWQVEKDMLCTTGNSRNRECNEVWMSGKRVKLRLQDGSLPDESILRNPEPRLWVPRRIIGRVQAHAPADQHLRGSRVNSPDAARLCI